MIIAAEWVIDGTGAAPLRHARIGIRDGLIDKVEGVEGIVASTADISFPGCTILPGLIDTHVHLTFGALDSHEAVVRQVTTEPEPILLARAIGNAQAALRAGVTTLRDCGGRGLLTLAVRDAIRRGHVVGPDVLVSGMPITTTSGHLHYLGLRADTEAEVRAAAESMAEAGVDFIKLIATGGNMTPSSNRLASQYDTPALCAAAEAAREHRLHTAAHVLARCALPQCIEAGIRTIEHCMWRTAEDRLEFDAELARRLALGEHYVGFTFTAPTWRKILPTAAGLDAALMGDLDARFDTERRTIDAGVKYTIHTDAGVRQTPFGAALRYVLEAAVQELQLTPLEAIRAVTATAAEAIGLADRGIIAPGLRADLLVVEGNPSRRIADIGNVRRIMLGGEWVSFPSASG